MGKPTQLRRGYWDARLFVWATWCLMLAGAYWLVASLGSPAPYDDDWVMIPALTGHQPITLSWLWSQHNDHRLPLPRLIFVGLHCLVKDWRINMLFTVTMVGALAGAFIWCAQQVRGYSDYPDAFFAVALLHWGHFNNFLWSIQLAFVVPLVLIGLVLSAAALNRYHVAAACCLIGCPLCTSFGAAVTPFPALWLIGVGVRQRRYAVVIPAAVALVLALTYCVSLESTTPRGDVLTSLKGGIQFLAAGFGCVAPRLWPALGIPVAGLLCVFLLSLIRARAVGLLSLFVAFAVLTAAMGCTRYFTIFAPRYITLAVLPLCGIYLAALLHFSPGFGRFLSMSLLVCACLLLWPNYKSGAGYSASRQALQQRFAEAAQSGASVATLIHDFPDVYPYSEQPEYLEIAKAAAFYPFKKLDREDAPAATSATPCPCSCSAKLFPGYSSESRWHNALGRRQRQSRCTPSALVIW